ncbi:hypothetical protein CR983_00250 [Candidatus Saccharibacteria bacterium]|nr:MAG: hypothetical protein CR983_00250 [Candidatus Saccharibacteria bacterium]
MRGYRFKDDYPVVRQLAEASTLWSWCARFVWCGLKGKMALGDAHPYLALFYLLHVFFWQTGQIPYIST